MPNLHQNADGSMGIQGSDADSGAFITFNLPYNANANTSGAFLNVLGPVLKRRMIVHRIEGVVETGATNAVTATVYAAKSGTALASGTALHTGTFNLQGTAATNQNLTLSTDTGTLDLAAGTRVGFAISGAPGAAGMGTITVTLTPA